MHVLQMMVKHRSPASRWMRDLVKACDASPQEETSLCTSGSSASEEMSMRILSCVLSIGYETQRWNCIISEGEEPARMHVESFGSWIQPAGILAEGGGSDSMSVILSSLRQVDSNSKNRFVGGKSRT